MNRNVFAYWPAALSIAVIGAITLTPGIDASTGARPWCFACGQRGLADFYYLSDVDVAGRRIFAIIWLIFLFLPSGAVLRSVRGLGVTAIASSATLAFAPRVLGLPATPWWELAAVISGLSAGYYLASLRFPALADHRLRPDNGSSSES